MLKHFLAEDSSTARNSTQRVKAKKTDRAPTLRNIVATFLYQNDADNWRDICFGLRKELGRIAGSVSVINFLNWSVSKNVDKKQYTVFFNHLSIVTYCASN